MGSRIKHFEEDRWLRLEGGLAIWTTDVDRATVFPSPDLVSFVLEKLSDRTPNIVEPCEGEVTGGLLIERSIERLKVELDKVLAIANDPRQQNPTNPELKKVGLGVLDALKNVCLTRYVVVENSKDV